MVKSHVDPKAQLSTWRASLTGIAGGVLPHSTLLAHEGVLAGSPARLAGWQERMVHQIVTSGCKADKFQQF